MAGGDIKEDGFEADAQALFFVWNQAAGDGNPGKSFAGLVDARAFENAPVAKDGLNAAAGRGDAELFGEGNFRVRREIALVVNVLAVVGRNSAEGGDVEVLAELGEKGFVGHRLLAKQVVVLVPSPRPVFRSECRRGEG